MSKVVLDASAVLAVLRQEPGYEKVLPRLDQAVLSAINFSEVISTLARTAGDLTQVRFDLQNLIRDIRPFDTNQAIAVGELVVQTRALGLSLGDRACLMLAKSLAAPVLTADQVWSKLDIGVQIEMIR